MLSLRFPYLIALISVESRIIRYDLLVEFAQRHPGVEPSRASSTAGNNRHYCYHYQVYPDNPMAFCISCPECLCFAPRKSFGVFFVSTVALLIKYVAPCPWLSFRWSKLPSSFVQHWLRIRQSYKPICLRATDGKNWFLSKCRTE